jgi:hypothetical protein
MSASFVRYSLLRFESFRESTFTKWPLEKPTAKELAESGFYYTGYSTCATCFSCGLSSFNWNYPATPPIEKHRQLKPQCRFLNGIDFSLFSPKIEFSAEINLKIQTFIPHVPNFKVDPADNGYIFSDSTIYEPPEKFVKNSFLCGPSITVPMTTYTRIPENNSNMILDSEGFLLMMRNEKQRLETFNVARWSHTKPSKISMAAAGFYHLQLSDYTQCAFCLMNVAVWNEVDPKEFHKSENPQCPFMKGEDVGNIPMVIENVDRIRCNVCLLNDRNIVFLPCKHCSCCEECGLRSSIQ